jgi:hypothetical protein
MYHQRQKKPKTEKTCITCKVKKKIKAYPGPRSRKCNTCRRKAKLAKGMRGWDWANCIHKSTSMHAGSIGVEFDPGLTPGSLRAIMAIQNYRCAISGLSLVLPESTIVFSKNTTLTSWANTRLSKEDKARLPVLVRNIKGGTWCEGNVIFIAKCLAPLHDAYSSQAQLKVFLARMSAIEREIPQSTAIHATLRRRK